MTTKSPADMTDEELERAVDGGHWLESQVGALTAEQRQRAAELEREVTFRCRQAESEAYYEARG